MSQSRCFTLLGDSNIRQFVNKNSCRANPALKAAQVLQCGHFQIFGSMLEQIRPESNACIVACLTNFIASAVDVSSTVSHRVEPVLSDIKAMLHEVCGSNPGRDVLLSPPMYRASPVWYREGLPEILTLFSQTFSPDRPENLHILPSFATPEFGPGGVHLTAYSGLEYILHLFDSSQELLDNLKMPQEAKTSKTCESTRVLEDRVMALEQDHRRLNRVVEYKIAVDSEQADYLENMRYEDCFIVEGLPQLSSDLVGKDWQKQAVLDTQDFIKTLMGRQMDIVFISNSTNRYKGAINSYTVKMVHVADSSAIRRKFGSYFVGGDKRPPALKPYSVKNRITPATKIRISLLKLFTQRYRDSNRGSKVKVIGYDPRPLLKILPAQSASDRRQKSFNFIEAVKELPSNFTEAELEPIMKKINSKFAGKLRSIFIVLSDDQFKKHVPKFRNRNGANASEEGAEGEGDAETDVEDLGQPDDQAMPPVPVPAPIGTATSVRNPKRGASSPAESGPPKK